MRRARESGIIEKRPEKGGQKRPKVEKERGKSGKTGRKERLERAFDVVSISGEFRFFFVGSVCVNVFVWDLLFFYCLDVWLLFFVYKCWWYVVPVELFDGFNARNSIDVLFVHVLLCHPYFIQIEYFRIHFWCLILKIVLVI